MISNAKKILIETDCVETLVLRTSPRATRIYCSECDEEVAMLDLNSAVTVSGRAARNLIAHLDSGELHSVQTPEGYLLICGISLTESLGIKFEKTDSAVYEVANELFYVEK